MLKNIFKGKWTTGLGSRASTELAKSDIQICSDSARNPLSQCCLWTEAGYNLKILKMKVRGIRCHISFFIISPLYHLFRLPSSSPRTSIVLCFLSSGVNNSSLTKDLNSFCIWVLVFAIACLFLFLRWKHPKMPQKILQVPDMYLTTLIIQWYFFSAS